MYKQIQWAQESFDISADLQELARTPVAVVCAGVKSILDVQLTLEYLETHGVPVMGYCTNKLPGFYSRDGAFGVDMRMDDPSRIAGAMQANWALGLNSGLVIANPIPASFAIPWEVVDLAIEQAQSEANAEGVSGKQVTPFLISRVNALTGGSSTSASVHIGLNNAKLAAEVARAYSSLKSKPVPPPLIRSSVPRGRVVTKPTEVSDVLGAQTGSYLRDPSRRASFGGGTPHSFR